MSNRRPTPGEIIDGLFRVTQVWIRQADQWRLAALQYTSLPKA